MNRKIFGILMVFLIISVISAVSIKTDAAETLIKVTLLNQNPSPAATGDTVDLTFSVENLGDSQADNVQVELVSEYPFTVLGQTLQNAGTLYAFQSGTSHVSLDYKLKVDKDATAGTYDLKLRYKYGAGNWVEKTTPIDITSNTYAQLIYIDKSSLLPGKETNITFKITNTGSSPLQNMIFSWAEENNLVLPVHSDNSRYIKYLDIGNSVDLMYTVIADVNANPGLYKIDMSLNYQSQSNSTTSVVNSKAGIFIGGETDFDVAFSQSSAGQTSLSVANIGNTPALSVSVRIPQQSDYRVSGSDTAIIGNLDKGDYTLVSFQIASRTNGTNVTGRNFTGQRNPQPESQGGESFQRASNFTRTSQVGGLRVLIDYTDTTGERRTVEKFVSIQFRDDAAAGFSGAGRVAANTGFIGSTMFYILLAGAVISCIIVYRKRKTIFGNKK